MRNQIVALGTAKPKTGLVFFVSLPDSSDGEDKATTKHPRR